MILLGAHGTRCGAWRSDPGAMRRRGCPTLLNMLPKSSLEEYTGARAASQVHEGSGGAVKAEGSTADGHDDD
jgi:hypothetical protein